MKKFGLILIVVFLLFSFVSCDEDKELSEYKVSFNSDGGSGHMDDQIFTEGVSQILSSCKFTKEGYYFLNWKDADGNKYSNGQSINIVENLNLVAVWKEYCIVTFKSGNGEELTQKFKEGETKALTKNSFERENYYFDGWKDEEDNLYKDEYIIKIENDLTLTAVWKKLCKVTFKSGYDGGGESVTQEFKEGVAQALKRNTFNRDGFDFIGWEDSDGNSYEDEEEITIDNDLDLKAKWLENFYVEFEQGGGLGDSMSSQKFFKGKKQALSPNSYYKDNYFFDYWKDQYGNKYTDEQEINITKDLTLTAVWSNDMKTFELDKVNGISFSLKFISKVENTTLGGKYETNTVSLSAYLIGETEVTQELWQAVMGDNPSKFKGSGNLPAEEEVQEKRPVEKVSWYDCIDFCNKLTKKVYGDTTDKCVYYSDSSFTTVYVSGENVYMDMSKKGFRLPTEAEWQYAAMGGKNYIYAGSNTIEDVAWYKKNSNKKTHQVKKLASNGYGLYDMSGNVWEWCFDGFQSTPALGDNPVCVDSVYDSRVVRGGCWGDIFDYCSVASRYGNDPAPVTGADRLGLRLAGRF